MTRGIAPKYAIHLLSATVSRCRVGRRTCSIFTCVPVISLPLNVEIWLRNAKISCYTCCDIYFLLVANLRLSYMVQYRVRMARRTSAILKPLRHLATSKVLPISKRRQQFFWRYIAPRTIIYRVLCPRPTMLRKLGAVAPHRETRRDYLRPRPSIPRVPDRGRHG